MTPVAFNDAGQIAGNLGNGVLSRAAVFDPLLGFRTPDNVSPFSEAFDLNDAGTVVGRRGQDTLTTVGFMDRNGTLDSIPLSMVVTQQEASVLQAISRLDRERAISVSGNVAPGRSHLDRSELFEIRGRRRANRHQPALSIIAVRTAARSRMPTCSAPSTTR